MARHLEGRTAMYKTLLPLLALTAAGCLAGEITDFQQAEEDTPMGAFADQEPDEIAVASVRLPSHPDDPVAGSRKMVETFGDVHVIEGDILVRPENIEWGEPSAEAAGSIAGAVFQREPSWPGGVIPYRFDATQPNDQRVLDAIAAWEANTSLRFVEQTTERDFLQIVSAGATGCSSFVGRQGRAQEVNLSAGCNTGSTIHELGHAIGMPHEHTRPDRDQFVVINVNNIAAGRAHNFDISPAAVVSAYDTGSIMHYGSWSFSGNGQPTIERLDGTRITANRTRPSVGDFAVVETVYANNLLPVRNLRGSSTSSSITVRWLPAASGIAATRYRVRVNGGPWVTTSNTNYTAYNLSATGIYHFAVVAQNNNGRSSEPRTIDLSTESGPTIPSSLRASVYSSSALELFWQRSTSPTNNSIRYRIRRNGVIVGENTGSSFYDSGLQRARIYSYEVTAIDSTGESHAARVLATTNH